MALYTYSIDFDFIALVGTVVNLNEIEDLVIDNVIIVTVIHYVEQNGTDIIFKFNLSLSGAEKTELDNIVATYILGVDYGTTDTSGSSIIINLLKEVQTNGTNGGTFYVDTSADNDDSDDENRDTNNNVTWQTRKLNTIEGVDIFVSLSNNEITLPSGIYYISASAPAYKVKDHQIRIRNRTTSAVLSIGTSEYADKTQTRSHLATFLTLSTSTIIELQHRAQKKRNNDGLGRATGFGNNEVYSIVEISKIE